MHKISLCKKKYIIEMVEFLIDNIFVMFGGYAFQQTVGIHTIPTVLLI